MTNIEIELKASGAYLNGFCSLVHTLNQRWWHDLATGERLNRNLGELLMLVVSEIAEAMEGHRKGGGKGGGYGQVCCYGESFHAQEQQEEWYNYQKSCNLGSCAHA